MSTTNDELKALILEQTREGRERGAGVDERLEAIEKEVARTNGTVKAHTFMLERLPCAERGDELTRVATLVEASLTPREQGRLEATVGAQPTARESGRMEERQGMHRTNWQRVWDVLKLPITGTLSALGGAFAALLLSGKI